MSKKFWPVARKVQDLEGDVDGVQSFLPVPRLWRMNEMRTYSNLDHLNIRSNSSYHEKRRNRLSVRRLQFRRKGALGGTHRFWVNWLWVPWIKLLTPFLSDRPLEKEYPKRAPFKVLMATWIRSALKPKRPSNPNTKQRDELHSK